MELRPKPSIIKIILVIMALLIGGGAGGVGLAYYWHKDTPIAPESVRAAAKFPLYVPTKLPGNFEIDMQSFALQEDNTLVVFTAKDSTGAIITFTQQAIPKDFNFSKFHSEQIKDASLMNNVPYASTWGKSLNGNNQILSVVTDKTWLIASTFAPINQEGAERIAGSLLRQ